MFDGLYLTTIDGGKYMWSYLLDFCSVIVSSSFDVLQSFWDWRIRGPVSALKFELPIWWITPDTAGLGRIEVRWMMQ